MGFSVVANEGGPGAQAEWEPDELIDVWTLVKSDWDLIANKAGLTFRRPSKDLIEVLTAVLALVLIRGRGSRRRRRDARRGPPWQCSVRVEAVRTAPARQQRPGATVGWNRV